MISVRNIFQIIDSDELIPVGGEYTSDAMAKTLVGDGKSVYFPTRMHVGDTYRDESYEYICEYSEVRVKVRDKTRKTYGPLRSHICDKTITSLRETFMGCESMAEAPELPKTVTNLGATFHHCFALEKAPVLPHGVSNMINAFSSCMSLTETPDLPHGVKYLGRAFADCKNLVKTTPIPRSVKSMPGIFSGCSKLVGTIVCNANPESFAEALKNTEITEIEGMATKGTKEQLLETR